VFGHRGRSGQVVASGLESVFIGGPVDTDDNAVRRSIRVRSSGDGADIFRFRSDFLLASAFLNFGAVSRFEAANVKTITKIKCDPVNTFAVFSIANLLEGVAAVGVHFAVG